jgi:hypothetical protein
MLKYLRIAVTALSLTACVLLVALWVRSYRHIVLGNGPIWGTTGISVGVLPGHISWSLTDSPQINWNFKTESVEDYVAVFKSLGREFHFISGFRLHERSGYFPIWFLIVLVGTPAILLWIPYRRQFSLRTLLIATTLVAVGLGILVSLL